MHIVGKDTATENRRRQVDRLPLREQKKYYYSTESWLLFYNSCFQLGELTKKELLRLRKEVIYGK